jgi:hypothetical protein
MTAGPVGAPANTEAVDGLERDGGAADRRELPRATSELPHADEVTQALASLQLPPPRDPEGASDASERATARRRFDADLAVWTPPGREQRDGRLPAVTLARMEQAYGQRFDDIEIHVDSAEVPTGVEAFTRGRHIFFGHGAFDPDSEHGEHVIAHELAHVAQQSHPMGSGAGLPTRTALETDAHQAALNALAGRAASVSLFAPPSAALGFSNGEPQQRPAPAPGATDRAPAQNALDGTPARPPGGPHTPSGPRTSDPTHAPTSAGHGSTGARSGATAAPGAAPHAAASTSPDATAPRRGASADGLLIPEAPNALTPAAAGRLHAIRTENQGVAAATTALPTAEQQTDVARAAVVEPQAEQDAHAQHDVVAAVDDRPPPSPEIEAACARIRQVIRDKRPPDEDKLVDAKPKEMAQAAGEEMSAGVEQRAGTVRQGYADMQQNPQGTPSTTPVPATLPPERAQTSPVDAAAGAPDPLHHDDVSLDGDVAAQQQKIQDAGMNTEAGQLVKDGPIGDARGGVGDLQTMAKTDPQKVLADQAAAITHAKGDMHALQAAAEKALADARAGTVIHMAKHTTGVKGSEEQQRAAAGAQMQAIFTRTQQSVDALLQPLSKNAVARWEAGVAQLSTDFESSLAEVKRKIDERHSGAFGGAVSLWDDWTGLPDWVTKDYDIAEAKFADGATSLITDISRDVNQVIEDCKKLIDQARKDIEAVVKSLPASLQTWAQGEADKLGKQLDQLSQKVDQTQHGLNQDLINRANGAVQTVRERVADLREQAKGLLNKIADALVEFAKNPAKAIVDGLLRLLGIPPASFWALVDKLGNVISGIAADPKKFANTLMSGVGQGFQQFFHNLPIHLGQSLFQWLFSKMSDAGIQMPLDFTMPSILTLVLQVMGITWPRIKTILAKHIGAENTEVLDQAYQLISTLINRGPLGVYHLVQEHLDPGMIIEAIKNAAISYVMEAIITRVAARIIMMLNPAGAILQAIEAIYRVIKWVIDNAARIFTLIEAVVNGAAQILAGNVSGVANLVERALGLLLVPVIDFLADYLGLSGIPNAIKNVIMGLQSKVEQILDKVIGFLVEKAKALWQAIKNKVKGDDKKDGQQPQGGNGEDVPVPRSIVEPRPATVDQPTPSLAAELAAVSSGTVIYQQSEANPQQVTRNVLSSHPDARYDRESRRLTLPGVSENALERASSLAELGQAIAQETGVSKVTITKTGNSFELHGHINPGTTVGRITPGSRDEKRLIYEALAAVRDEVLRQRGLAGTNPAADPAQPTPPTDDQEIELRFQRAMHDVSARYTGACSARFNSHGINGTVFGFAGKNYFVDHQANYVYPNREVGTDKAVVDDRIYVYGGTRGVLVPGGTHRVLNSQSDLSPDNKRDRLQRAYSYDAHSVPPETFRRLAMNAAYNVPIGENEGAIFLASMVAEPARNSIAHVTNLLLMRDTSDGNLLDAKRQPSGTAMPMTAGGTASQTRPRDPDLAGIRGIVELAPQDVTDREIDVVRLQVEARLGRPLSTAIAVWGADRAKTQLVQLLLRMVATPHTQRPENVAT